MRVSMVVVVILATSVARKYKDVNVSSCPKSKRVSIKQSNPVSGKINVSLNGGKGCKVNISLKKAVNTQVGSGMKQVLTVV